MVAYRSPGSHSLDFSQFARMLFEALNQPTQSDRSRPENRHRRAWILS